MSRLAYAVIILLALWVAWEDWVGRDVLGENQGRHVEARR